MKRQTADGENHRGTEAQRRKVTKWQRYKVKSAGEWENGQKKKENVRIGRMEKEEGERENWGNLR